MVLITAALSAFATVCAGDDTQTVSMDDATHSQPARRTIPKQPDKGWKISAKDYALLLEECGQTSTAGLAAQRGSGAN